MSAEYSKDWGWQHLLNCYPNIADPCTGCPNSPTAHLVALNDTHTFGPNLLLNVPYGLTRGSFFRKGPQGDFPNQNVDAVCVLGMPKYMDLSGIPNLPLNLAYQLRDAGSRLADGEQNIAVGGTNRQ